MKNIIGLLFILLILTVLAEAKNLSNEEPFSGYQTITPSQVIERNRKEVAVNKYINMLLEDRLLVCFSRSSIEASEARKELLTDKSASDLLNISNTIVTLINPK